MRITVLGGTGHIGSFLVPRLVRAGHEVTSISRHGGSGYSQAPEWDQVRQVELDREQADADGSLGATLLDLGPEVVIDLICYTTESASALVEALRGRVDHLLHCGSTWRHGVSRWLPITEDGQGAEPPHDEYGRGKAAIASMLQAETSSGGLVTTSIHPGHIVGPGWAPIGPLGNNDLAIWGELSSGRPIVAPGSGTETMHHVHADDVGQAFELAVRHRDRAAGEDFNVLAPDALSVRGYTGLAAGWFGRECPLRTVSWQEFEESAGHEMAAMSRDHLHRSQVFSIAKAERLLGYRPQYTSGAAVLESVRWLADHGRIDLASPLVA